MEQEFYVGRLRAARDRRARPGRADRGLVHRVIYEELCVGVVDAESRAQYRRIMRDLVARGAEGILLGCTEIDLLVGRRTRPCRSSTRHGLHAERAVELAVAGDA